MARKNPKNPDATRPLSCVLYIRVSTKLQVEKGESIDAQRFELTRYAEAHGMRVLGEYVDAGFSGKNVRGRPQFRQMLDDIIKEQPGRRPTYVLVFKLSRFGRNAADTWNSLQMLQDYGVELCCVKDGIDSATTMGKAMLSIAAVFAEMERDNIRTQTMSGREEKARKGYWNGGQAPYGYRLVDRGGKFKELVVDEDEAKVVRRIFKMYAYENKGPMAIASWLNRHGVTKAARGNATMETFGNTTIARMVVNPVYIGKIAYGRRRTEVIEGTRGETHVVKSDGYEVYDGRHEAIIDEATWAAAQAIVGTRKPNAKRHDDGHVNLLNGLLVCPECGRKMSSHPNRGKVKKDGTRGKTTYAYYCPHTSKARGATCTFRRQYPQEYVDAEVVEMVKLASRSDAFVEALRRRINDETDVEQLREDAERIGREQAANDKRMRMLMNQIDALDPADRSYERKFSDLQRRLDDLYDRDAGFQEALEETRAKIAAADKRRVGERRLLDELDRIPELLEEADEQTRFDIVHEAVSEVRILAGRNPRKERVVQSVTFKCPVRFFWEEVPGEADGYTAVTPDSFDADGNFRDDETHVETIALVERVEGFFERSGR